MLTKEKINGVDGLKGLSDDQIKLIEKLSKNDEQSVIDENRSTWWKKLDEDLQDVFGEEKPFNVKSYAHLKSVLGDAKKKGDDYDSLKSQFDKNEGLISDLKKQLKEKSGDEGLKKQLEDAEKQRDKYKGEFDDMKKKYTEKENEVETIKGEKDGMLLNFDLQGRFSNVLSDNERGIKFIQGLPKGVIEREIAAAKDRVSQRGKATYETDSEGKKHLVFVDENGVTLKNKAKGLDAYSAADLFYEELEKAEILDLKGMKGGAGGKGGGGKGGGSGDFVNLNGIKTQTEAFAEIENHFLSNGSTRLDRDFQSKVLDYAKENGVFDLPQE